MPPFTLAPWELPPDCDAPFLAPADFVFRSSWDFGHRAYKRETEIWVRTVAYKDAFLHFFCDGERPQNGNWVVSFGVHEPFCEKPWKEEHLKEWFGNEGDDLWYDYVSRLLFFEGAPFGFLGPHWVSVAPSSGECHLRFGAASFKGQYNRRRVAVTSPFLRHQAPARAATTKNLFLAALGDENSEARFALKWLHLSPAQRRQQQARFERGPIKAMRHILLAALQSQPGIWEQNSPLVWRTHHERKPFGSPKFDYGSHLFFPDEHNFHEAPDVPPRLTRWKVTICAFYLPLLENPWFVFARCLSQHPAGGIIDVRSEPPTAHEQIEALLLLREWWQQHFPPELFDAHNANDETS